MQNPAQQVNRLHQRVGASPLILFILGGLVLIMLLCATVVQIQTSEYLALGSKDRVAGVAWDVLTQPYQMVTGTAPVTEVMAWLYGWIVETVTLVFALALSIAVAKISAANPHLGRWFVLFGAVLLVLNSWADYSSSPGTSPLVQVLVALAVGGIAVIGLPLGVGLIEHGFSELKP